MRRAAYQLVCLRRAIDLENCEKKTRYDSCICYGTEEGGQGWTKKYRRNFAIAPLIIPAPTATQTTHAYITFIHITHNVTQALVLGVSSFFLCCCRNAFSWNAEPRSRRFGVCMACLSICPACSVCPCAFSSAVGLTSSAALFLVFSFKSDFGPKSTQRFCPFFAFSVLKKAFFWVVKPAFWSSYKQRPSFTTNQQEKIHPEDTGNNQPSHGVRNLSCIPKEEYIHIKKLKPNIWKKKKNVRLRLFRVARTDNIYFSTKTHPPSVKRRKIPIQPRKKKKKKGKSQGRQACKERGLFIRCMFYY